MASRLLKTCGALCEVVGYGSIYEEAPPLRGLIVEDFLAEDFAVSEQDGNYFIFEAHEQASHNDLSLCSWKREKHNEDGASLMRGLIHSMTSGNAILAR